MSKNSILASIIVVVLIAAGGVLYFGIFKSGAGVNDQAPIDANQQNIVNLMPYGEQLNFNIIKNRTDAEAPYSYKKVSPTEDIGHEQNDLFINLDVGVEATGVPKPTVNVEGREFLLPR